MSAHTDFAITVQLIHFAPATSRTVLRVRGLTGVHTRCEEIVEAKRQKKERGHRDVLENCRSAKKQLQQSKGKKQQV